MIEKRIPVTTPIWAIAAAVIKGLERNLLISDIIRLPHEIIIKFHELEVRQHPSIRSPISISDTSGFTLKMYGNGPLIFQYSLECSIDPEMRERANALSQHKINGPTSMYISGNQKIYINRNQFENITTIENADQHCIKFKFVQENVKKVMSFLTCVCYANNAKYSYDIPVNSFYKLNPIIGLFDQIEMPSKTTRNNLISTIMNFDKSKVDNIKSYNFSIKKLAYDFIECKYIGLSLFKENNLEMFKYLNHPGINFMALHLEKSNKYLEFITKANKEMFKVL